MSGMKGALVGGKKDVGHPLGNAECRMLVRP